LQGDAPRQAEEALLFLAPLTRGVGGVAFWGFALKGVDITRSKTFSTGPREWSGIAPFKRNSGSP